MSGVWAHGFEHVVEFGDGAVGWECEDRHLGACGVPVLELVVSGVGCAPDGELVEQNKGRHVGGVVGRVAGEHGLHLLAVSRSLSERR